MGTNSTAGISSDGSSNTFVDNLFTGGNASNFTSAGSGNHVVAYKSPLSAASQDYFYPPLIDDQHTNTIVNGMGRTDLTIASTTIDSVQSQYNGARSANPNNVIVLHLNGTFTVGASALALSDQHMRSAQWHDSDQFLNRSERGGHRLELADACQYLRRYH